MMFYRRQPVILSWRVLVGAVYLQGQGNIQAKA